MLSDNIIISKQFHVIQWNYDSITTTTTTSGTAAATTSTNITPTIIIKIIITFYSYCFKYT